HGEIVWPKRTSELYAALVRKPVKELQRCINVDHTLRSCDRFRRCQPRNRQATRQRCTDRVISSKRTSKDCVRGCSAFAALMALIIVLQISTVVDVGRAGDIDRHATE